MANMMRAAQAKGKGAPLELVDLPIPQPGRDQVVVKIEACGVCHSDSLTVQGGPFPIEYPRVPGHEIVGRVHAVGEDVDNWKPGQRAGIGWYGGHCGKCEACRRGDLVACRFLKTPGISYDGGYAEYIVAPAVALAAVPESLDSVEAAPLLCAGVTTFNALRNSGAKPPDLVAVLGIGGLGHLGVQFAARMGFRVAAIARGDDKGDFIHKLGAHYYIDSNTQDPAAELQKLGGARTILSTVTSADAMSAAIGGLGLNGRFMLLGVDLKPLSVNALPMIGSLQALRGWSSGTSIDSEDTLVFSDICDVHALIERYPLAEANAAYQRMMSGKARFRVVLQM